MNEGERPVLWGILAGRATQHACQVVSEPGDRYVVIRFECLSRSVAGARDELGFRRGVVTRATPWPPDEVVLCKRHWCTGHYELATRLSPAQRALMRKALLKIEEDLADPEALSQ